MLLYDISYSPYLSYSRLGKYDVYICADSSDVDFLNRLITAIESEYIKCYYNKNTTSVPDAASVLEAKYAPALVFGVLLS